MLGFARVTETTDKSLEQAAARAARRFALTDIQLDEWTAGVRATLELEGDKALNHLDDLALAFAVTRNSIEALRVIEAEVIPAAALAAGRIDSEPQFVDEVLADLRSKLLVGEPKTHPLLGYLGLGPLSSWFQVAAMRVALTLKRKRARDTTLEEDLIWLEAHAAGDVEQQIAALEGQSVLRQALKAAAQELEPRERNLLRLYHVEDVSSETLGTMYGVHRATVARWISSAHETLAMATRKHLRAVTKMNDSSIESLVCAARGDVFLNASSVLTPSL